MSLPASFTLFGVSNNGNTITYLRAGHTTRTPRLAIFKRTVPVYLNGRWSNPSYDVKIVSGVLDADGAPVPVKIQIGTDGIRWPMVGVDVNSTFASALADFAAIMSEVGMDQTILSQVFPAAAQA